MQSMTSLATRFLHLLPPEASHRWAVHACGAYGRSPVCCPVPKASPMLAQKLWGLSFPHPLGMAAGFDKNAQCVDGLLRLGFAFVEAGTVTPHPQPGNPSPRLFRLTEDAAIINRLGFNNHGIDAFCANLERARKPGVVGANIGKNKESQDAIEDYRIGLERCYPHADYITLNVSSPNTPGLRNLQHGGALKELLTALQERREQLVAETHLTRPMLLKIAPDMGLDELELLIATARPFVDGVIISNTTIARPSSLRSCYAAETGGLSGTPLFEASTALLAHAYRMTEGQLPLIGVGGIASAEDAYRKIRAGASLLQLYTAFIYQGPGVVSRILSGLPELLRRDGFASIGDAVGASLPCAA